MGIGTAMIAHRDVTPRVVGGAGGCQSCEAREIRRGGRHAPLVPGSMTEIVGMNQQIHNLTRQELYEAVWAEPMRDAWVSRMWR